MYIILKNDLRTTKSVHNTQNAIARYTVLKCFCIVQ